MDKVDILKKYEFYNNADFSFKKKMENASVAPYFYEGDQCRKSVWPPRDERTG